MKKLSTIILNSLINDNEYSRRVIPHIKSEYFESEAERQFFNKVAEYTAKYLVPPTIDAIIIDIVNDKEIKEHVAKELDSLIEEVRAPMEKQSLDWLVDQTEKYCQHRAVFNGIQKSIKLMTEDNVNGILDVFKDALAVTFQQSIGHDYLEDAAARWEYYHRVENKIPFRMDLFNKITGNGLSKKTLTLIYAGTHVGKSAHMCSLAADNMLNGNNVLYITNEMSEEETAMRIDAKLMDTPIPQVRTMEKESYDRKIASIQRKNMGKLIIKQYPTATAHVGMFRALLDELKLKKGFVPDVIYVDYLNICASQRMKMNANVSSYTYMKVIAEEIRGLAVERDVAIVTASQLNRSASTSSDPGMDDVSESFGISMTGDLIYALVATPDLMEQNIILVKQLKNRYTDVNTNNKFFVEFERLKMNFRDAASHHNADNYDGPASKGVPTPQEPDEEKRRDFSNFKFE